MPVKISPYGLPYCPEVCECCIKGTHVYHEITELGDIHAKWATRNIRGKDIKYLEISGYAEDEFWLKQLLGAYALSREDK